MTVPSVDRTPLRAGLLALASGALAGLALPPLGLPLLLWPALALLWQLVHAGRRTAILLWGLAAVLVSHRWLLWLHPLDWIGVPAPLSLPLCLVIWLACGLAGGALVLLWSLPWRRLGLERLDTALLAATLWGLAEVLLARGPLFWIGLGASPLPSDRALAGLGSLGGAGLIAATQLLIGWGLWQALQRRQRRRRDLALLLLLVLSAHLLGAGALRQAEGLAASAAAAETLVVLQPAIPTRQKFEPAQQRRLLEQLAQTLDRLPAAAAAAAEPPRGVGTDAISAVLLPEGALPLDQPLPRTAPVEVLSGGFRRQGEGLRSALLRFAPGERWPAGGVDKHRLVPLGEWVPLANLLRWSGLSAIGGLEPGESSRLLERPRGAIGVAICYELADGQSLAQASRAGARWLLASANLDPYPALLQQQFSAVAQLRAIETQRWLVSAANTGPSLLVDPAGRLRGGLPPQVQGRGLIQLWQLRRLSAYSRWGEGPLVAVLVLAAVSRTGFRPLATLRSSRV